MSCNATSESQHHWKHGKKLEGSAGRNQLPIYTSSYSYTN